MPSSPTAGALAKIEAERPRPKPGAPPVGREKTAEPAPSLPAKESKPAVIKTKSPAAKVEAPGMVEAPAKPANAPPKVEKPASKPPAPPAEAQEPSEPLPPRKSGEPEVREWISRFVDPDNPIQIGLHAGSDAGPFLKGDERDLDIEIEAAGSAGAPAPPKPPRKAGGLLPLRPRRGQRDTTWITASAGGVALLAALVVFVPRMRSTGSAPADSAAVAVAPTHEPTPTPQQRASRRRETPRTASPTKPASVDTVAATPHWQGIEVATYLDPYRASSESTRLSELTGLSTRVLESSDPNGDAYRVVLGSFGSRRKAERAADDLIRRGVIDEARVVPLGIKSP
jgi:cell division protein FtsN